MGLEYLFLGVAAPTCLKAADANDDGRFDMGDAIATLNYLFLGGPPPAPPFESCSLDLTADLLGRAAHDPCA